MRNSLGHKIPRTRVVVTNLLPSTDVKVKDHGDSGHLLGDKKNGNGR